MFKQITSYCVAIGNPFECYEDAEKAYLKHKERVATRKFNPFYKDYHKVVRIYFRKNRKYRHYPLYDYDFHEVLDYMKRKHYFGKQCFNCRGNSDNPELVYCKDGVEIYYEGSWDYIEVFGLRPCDFYVLKQAHERIMSKKWAEFSE